MFFSRHTHTGRDNISTDCNCNDDTQVAVQLNPMKIKWEGKLLCIDIEDNGKGFDVVDAVDKNRNGLKNMRARVEKYRKGIFSIQSGEAAGTKIHCCLPAKNNPKM